MSNEGASAFVNAAQSKQVVTCLDLGSAVVLAYDIALHTGDEVQLIWFSPWSLGKTLYFLTRYPVIIDTTLVLYHQFAVMDPGQCDIIFKTIGYLLGIGTLIAEGILVMRTWVIWNRSPYIGVLLVSGLVVCWVPIFYFLAQSLNSLVFSDPPHPQTPGCFLKSQKNILFVVFLIITGFESLVLILTLIRFVQNSLGHKKSALIRIIYRDGAFNYVWLCVLSICNVVVLLTAPPGYTTSLSALQRVMHSILSSRVLLNLRQAAAGPAYFDSMGSATNHEVLFQPWSAYGVEEDAGIALRTMRPRVLPRIIDEGRDEKEETLRQVPRISPVVRYVKGQSVSYSVNDGHESLSDA